MNFAQIPGLIEEKKSLVKMARNEKVPHALMFMGKKGAPVLPMALSFAQYLQCENPQDVNACQTCNSCRLASKNQHPDINFIFPIVLLPNQKTTDVPQFLPQWRNFLEQFPFGTEKEWRNTLSIDKTPLIPVEVIRSMIKQMSYTAFGTNYKILICWMSEKMNISAANAMLKIIEEPPQKTVMIFCTENIEKIVATVQSRTQKINIPMFNDEEILSVLKDFHPSLTEEEGTSLSNMASGDVQRALEYVEDSGFEEDIADLFWGFMRICYNKDFEKAPDWTREFQTLSKQKQNIFFSFALRTCAEITKILFGQSILFHNPKQEKSVIGIAKQLNINKLKEITSSFENYRYYLERNASAKIQLMSLSFQIAKIFMQ